MNQKQKAERAFQMLAAGLDYGKSIADVVIKALPEQIERVVITGG
jgi:hypothetical protein